MSVDLVIVGGKNLAVLGNKVEKWSEGRVGTCLIG